MATVNIRMTDLCDGENHAQIEITRGAQVRQVNMDIATLSAPVTMDDIEAFCKCAIRIQKETRTKAQMRALLEAGFNVTL